MDRSKERVGKGNRKKHVKTQLTEKVDRFIGLREIKRKREKEGQKKIRRERKDREGERDIEKKRVRTDKTKTHQVKSPLAESGVNTQSDPDSYANWELSLGFFLSASDFEKSMVTPLPQFFFRFCSRQLIKSNDYRYSLYSSYTYTERMIGRELYMHEIKKTNEV